MKVICLGDKHLKISRFDLALRYLSWAEELIAKEKPDIVVDLGDTFDGHAILRAEIKNEFRRHIDTILASGVATYYYVLGNHDFFRPNSAQYHALKDWEGVENLVIVDKVYDNGTMTFVPYLPDHTTFPKKTSRICFAHQTFVGADYGNQRPEIGVVSEDVSAEVIISGHIHKPQSFGKVIYPGSAYSQNLDDLGQVKQVLIFDTETYEKRFVTVPLPMWFKHSCTLSNKFDIDCLHNDVLVSVFPGNHWVLEITGPKAEILSYLSSLRFKELQSRIDIRIMPIFTDNKKQRVQIKSSSIDGIVDEYLEKIYTGTLDKQRIKGKVLELLSKTKDA